MLHGRAPRIVPGHSVRPNFGTRQADILGPQVGRDAIVKRFAGPLPPVLHLLANESITINGNDAVGYWTYLQPSVLGGRAYWVAGRYH